MEPERETPFTRRMRRLCAEGAHAIPAQAVARLAQLLDRCEGDFLPTAKKLLDGPMPPSLTTLARLNEPRFSLEWIILNETEWRNLFSPRDREIAQLRLDTARNLAAEGEPAP